MVLLSAQLFSTASFYIISVGLPEYGYHTIFGGGVFVCSSNFYIQQYEKSDQFCKAMLLVLSNTNESAR